MTFLRNQPVATESTSGLKPGDTVREKRKLRPLMAISCRDPRITSHLVWLCAFADDDGRPVQRPFFDAALEKYQHERQPEREPA